MKDILLRVVDRGLDQLVFAEGVVNQPRHVEQFLVVLRVVLAASVENPGLVTELLVEEKAREHHADVAAGRELGVRDRAIDELLARVGSHLLQAVIWSALGIALFLVALKICVTITPFSVRKEIEEDQNVALGILLGAVFIALGLIVSAAVQG